MKLHHHIRRKYKGQKLLTFGVKMIPCVVVTSMITIRVPRELLAKKRRPRLTEALIKCAE